jgi:hypothetical protein
VLVPLIGTSHTQRYQPQLTKPSSNKNPNQTNGQLNLLNAEKMDAMWPWSFLMALLKPLVMACF